ncbi:XisH family protein [Pannus brasiliensis CCIBt3594]|uniref:XisH family protein n=1 Tax=Pannus brasiliensis CCIBt3594 TaxID=1427578 RepID=A0AAW9QXN4_9CHRO
MPAKDIYHDAVKNALIKDGWVILADPYFLQFGDVDLFADLLVEKPLLAEKRGNTIVVEIKSFISFSLIRDLQNALGQYLIYRDVLELTNQNYEIYLAIRDTIFEDFFQKDAIQAIVKRHGVKFIVFNDEREKIASWIN